MRPTRLCATALIILTVLLAACGTDTGGDGLDAPKVSLDQRPAAIDAESVSKSDTDEAGTDESSDKNSEGDSENGAESALPVIATATFQTTGIENLPVEVRIDINHLRRADNVVNLRLLLTNDGPNDYRPSIHLSDGALGTSADAISLIDYGSDLRYLTVVDEAGGCVCTDFSFGDLKPGTSMSITASFPAPPDAATVDIQLGNLGVVTDVPIAS